MRQQAGPSSALSSNVSSSDESDEGGENAPLMTAKEQHPHVRRVVPKTTVTAVRESRPLSASTGNVSKAEDAVMEKSSAIGSQSSLASAMGSSTSSLDSPLDTTDNEVYKTVIPKTDSSRRENSLAFMLNMAINELASETASTAATSSSTKQESNPKTETEPADKVAST